VYAHGHREPYHGRSLTILIRVIGILVMLLVVVGMVLLTAQFATKR
jgi:hypothetical protein